MRRTTALVVVISALLGFASHAAAFEGPVRPGRPIIDISLDLPTVNGFSARITEDRDNVTFNVVKGNRATHYTVEGKASEHKLTGRWPGLGSVSLHFRPIRTVYVENLPDGCHGLPSKEKLGVFTGHVHFRGEDGYVSIDARQARGRVDTLHYAYCRPRTQPHLDGTTPAEEEAAEKFEEIELQANAPHRSLEAVGVRKVGGGGAETFVEAAITEHQGAMKIKRSSSFQTGPGALRFDCKGNVATLRAPYPFSGSANFARTNHSHGSWSGSLRLNVLGAPPVSFAGKGFKATLFRTSAFEDGKPVCLAPIQG